MRLLFVTHNVPRHAGDAAGSFVLRLAVALREGGHDVHVVAPGAPGLPADDAVEGVPVTRVPYATASRMTLAYTGTMAEAVRASWGARLALLGLLRALRRAARAHCAAARGRGAPVDVVHAHWWFPAGLALWRARLPGGPPVVLTMHGSDVRLARGTPAVHPLMRAVLRAASVRTAVSAWLADEAMRIAPGCRVEVGAMPVDARLFAGAPRRLDDGRTLLFVGRLNAQKGLRDLLEALAQPALAAPPYADVVLEVVGDGPDRAALEARADTLGLAARVRWRGPLPQSALVPRYQAATAVVVPSREEGLGLVAVEAQLCGTPVIAYASGGLPDVVRPDAGGTLVTPGDVPALAGAIAQVLGDPARRERDGRRAQAAMRDRFTPQAVAERYVGWYRQALADRPAVRGGGT